MKRLVFFSLFFITSLYAQDAIIKIKTIADVFEYIDDELTLIFFDIDLTLGIPYPYPHHKEGFRLYLIEENSPLIINHLHRMGVKACALTARLPEDQELTIRQLADNGIDFSHMTPFTQHASHEVESTHGSRTITHINGVLCSGVCPKGSVVRDFLLHHVTQWPKCDLTKIKIIVIDDRVVQLNNIRNTLNSIGVTNIVCLQYTGVFGNKIPFELPRYQTIKKHKYKYIAGASSLVGIGFLVLCASRYKQIGRHLTQLGIFNYA